MFNDTHAIIIIDGSYSVARVSRVRPYTRIFSTMTIDGRIASRTGYSRLSCDEDFDLQHELRAWSDIVIVGSNTVLVDDPKLTVRRVPGKSPLRGVVDSRLRVPPSAKLFSIPGGVLVTTEDHDDARLEPYIEAGVTVLRAGKGVVDLVKAWKLLYEELGVSKVMVEGGGHLNYALLDKGLVDEVWVTVSPFVFGAGVSVFDGEGFDGLERKASFRLKDLKVLCGSWVNLRYEVLTPRLPLDI